MDQQKEYVFKHETFAKRISNENDNVALEKEMATLMQIQANQINHAKEMKEKIYIIKARLLEII